jgi:hypothetical protein
VHRGTQCGQPRPGQREEHGPGEPALCDRGHGGDYGGVLQDSSKGTPLTGQYTFSDSWLPI